MEKNRHGAWRFTAQEETAIAYAMAAEDSETRKSDEWLKNQITQILFDRARDLMAMKSTPDTTYSDIEKDPEVKAAFDLAVKTQDWFYCLLDARWPLRRIEEAEQFLSELNEYGVEQEKPKLEALVQELATKHRPN